MPVATPGTPKRAEERCRQWAPHRTARSWCLAGALAQEQDGNSRLFQRRHSRAPRLRLTWSSGRWTSGGLLLNGPRARRPVSLPCDCESVVRPVEAGDGSACPQLTWDRVRNTLMGSNDSVNSAQSGNWEAISLFSFEVCICPGWSEATRTHEHDWEPRPR